MDRADEKLPRGVFETSPGSNKFGIRVTNAYGNRPERVIGTRDQAIKAAQAARNERRCSKVLAPEKPKPTFREIADLGIAYARHNHCDDKLESRIEYFCKEFGDRIAEEISTTEIEGWLNSKAEKRDWSENEWNLGTKKGYRTAIRRCYREAVRLGLLDEDPTEPIEYCRIPHKKIRDVTPQELDRLRASIAIPGNHMRTPKFCRNCLGQLEIADQAGMRTSEQYGATWENIDWERQVLFVPKSKNNDSRDVYLNSYAIAILRVFQTEQTRDGVLPKGKIFDSKDARGWFNDTRKVAQIQDVSWKTLRHHFATHLVSVNVPIKHVQELMGHRDYESTARYIHPAAMDVMAAIALIADDGNPEYATNQAYLQRVLHNEAASNGTGMHNMLIGNEQSGHIPTDAPVDESTLHPRTLRHIPREELYELVWSQPVMHVARLLGRSDVAVAKSCRKRNIPLPGRGHWAKIAAAKPVPPRPVLPPS